MATRQNLIDTYLNNPTLQSKYTQQQYLDLFGFGQSTPTPTPTPPPTKPDPTPVKNIIGQNLNQDRGGGIQELQQTFTRSQPKAPEFNPNINPAAFLTGAGRLDPMGSDVDYFNAFGDDPRRFDFGFTTSSIPGQEGYQAPSKYFEEPSLMNKGITAVKDFFGRFTEPRVQGTLGDRLLAQSQGIASKIPLPGAMLGYLRSPFNPDSPTYNKTLVSELNFLEGMGPGMIGRDPGTGGLKYGPDSVLRGKNVISGFGTNSYAKALDNYIDKVTNKYNDIVDKYGVDSDKAVNYKFKFVDKAIKERQKNTDNAIKIAEDAKKAAELTAAASRAESKRQYDPNIHGATNYGLDSKGQQSYSGDAVGAPGLGFGVSATTGGPVSNKTGKGRTDYDDGGRVYLYDRQEMSEGGEAESYEDIIDAYENGVGVLKGESLTDYIRRNRIKLMDPMGDLEKALFGKANGGPIGESDFPFLINRPGENMGRKKPGLDYYDKYEDSPDDEYPIIEIPMGKMMKKKTKKKKKKKDREDYSDGGRVYLYDRQD
jgi:hypothetical protein